MRDCALAATCGPPGTAEADSCVVARLAWDVQTCYVHGTETAANLLHIHSVEISFDVFTRKVALSTIWNRGCWALEMIHMQVKFILLLKKVSDQPRGWHTFLIRVDLASVASRLPTIPECIEEPRP